MGGETKIKVTHKRDHAKRGYVTYGDNEYPEGSVPKETGWQARELNYVSPSNHNRITVCRVRRNTSEPKQYNEGEEG